MSLAIIQEYAQLEIAIAYVREAFVMNHATVSNIVSSNLEDADALNKTKNASFPTVLASHLIANAIRFCALPVSLKLIQSKLNGQNLCKVILIQLNTRINCNLIQQKII